MAKKIKVAIAGVGSRGKDNYAPCVRRYPEDMEIVAAADPRRENLEDMIRDYGVPRERCFASAEELLEQPKLADVLFICTMDSMHAAQAVAAMEKGYDLLLEKPVATTAPPWSGRQGDWVAPWWCATCCGTRPFTSACGTL